MRTVREVLLGRHRRVEPRLDAIRQEAIGMLKQRTTQGHIRDWDRGSFAWTWLSALRSLRWHLAGLGAAWLAIALLNIDHTSTAANLIAEHETPSPRQLMAALRENRRQLLEMMGTPVGEPALAPPRRSECVCPTAMA